MGSSFKGDKIFRGVNGQVTIRGEADRKPYAWDVKSKSFRELGSGPTVWEMHTTRGPAMYKIAWPSYAVFKKGCLDELAKATASFL